MNSQVFFTIGQKTIYKIGLHDRFTPAHGDAATGAKMKTAVFFYIIYYFPHRHFATRHFESTHRANGGTVSTMTAEGPVNAGLAISAGFQRLVFAGIAA